MKLVAILQIKVANAALANMLELLHVTENRYSGVPTIFRECKKAGLPEPKFSVTRGDFEVTLQNRFAAIPSMSGHGNIQEAVLAFCATPRSRQELVRFTEKSQYYTMSIIVKKLIEEGKLQRTLPDKPKSRKQRFVAVW